MGMSVTVVADYLMNNCVDLYDEIYNRGFDDGMNIDKTDEVKDFVNRLKEKISNNVMTQTFGLRGKDIFYLIDETLNELKDGVNNERI